MMEDLMLDLMFYLPSKKKSKFVITRGDGGKRSLSAKKI
jgi:hypothetical protein